MKDRRAYRGLQAAKISQGYLQFVDPASAGEFWYMLSEEMALFCPIEFR